MSWKAGTRAKYWWLTNYYILKSIHHGTTISKGNINYLSCEFIHIRCRNRWQNVRSTSVSLAMGHVWWLYEEYLPSFILNSLIAIRFSFVKLWDPIISITDERTSSRSLPWSIHIKPNDYLGHFQLNCFRPTLLLKTTSFTAPCLWNHFRNCLRGNKNKKGMKVHELQMFNI